EAMMLYELDFPDGVPVKQNIVDAAKWMADPAKGMLVNGPVGQYFNAWRGDNYGLAHGTCLDPMMGPMLGYASQVTGDPKYRDIGKAVLADAITQDISTPLIKSFTQQTRIVPAFLWFLQTPAAQAEAGTAPSS